MEDFGVSRPPEPGSTFLENALIKAQHASRSARLPAIADDSGLVVDALDGAPGVRSARFAGESATDDENIELVLERMRDLPAAERGAAFHCVIVALRAADDPTPCIAHGIWRGSIATSRRGGNGFGYDPIFIDPEYGRTAAELSTELKNLISHRGKALRLLKDQLAQAT